MSDFRYHEKTVYRRGALGGGFLNWNSRPEVFKTYRGLPSVTLAAEIQGGHKPFFQVLWEHPQAGSPELDVKKLSRILHLTYGITARSGQGPDAFFFRSVPSAGALYPCEVYVAVQDVSGVEDGLYHHDLARNRLVRLRFGRFLPSTGAWGAAFFITTLFYRSSWKYRDRAYRYCLLDAGHLVENALLVLKSEGLEPHLFDLFADKDVNAFLGVDPQKEACVAVICVPREVSWSSSPDLGGPQEFHGLEAVSRVDPVQPEACAMSLSDVVPRDILDAHRATELGVLGTLKGKSIAGQDTVARDGMEAEGMRIPRPENVPESLSFEETIRRRRSHRNYVSSAVSGPIWKALWNSLDLQPALCSSLELFIACGGTEGLPAGIYSWNAAEGEARIVQTGDFRRASTRACLDQEWLRQALFHFAWAVRWETVFSRHGPRGYRSAMLDAGRLGQRVYLASTALGLGCCGIGAFYDEELRDVFQLRPGCDVLYLTAAGPVKKLRS